MIISKAVLHASGCYNEWIVDNMQYETIVGSQSYGCHTDESDYDVYGFTIPPKEYILPCLFGYIPMFDKNVPKFEQYSTPGKFIYKKKEAEGTIYSIVRYFRLVADNNPNMVDSLFTRRHLHTHRTRIAEMVLEKRNIFLSKRCWHTFRGYASKQRKKILTKKPEGKRVAIVEKYGYDVKFAYHLVRLLFEVEQLLTTGDLDLMKDREVLKAIRRGEWTVERIMDFFERNEARLEKIYDDSKLPFSVNEKEIKMLLINCIEEFYGDLSIEKNANIADILNEVEGKVNDLHKIIHFYKGDRLDDVNTENSKNN